MPWEESAGATYRRLKREGKIPENLPPQSLAAREADLLHNVDRAFDKYMKLPGTPARKDYDGSENQRIEPVMPPDAKVEPDRPRYTFASLFSGGGLVECAAQQLALIPIWGVENNRNIAAYFVENFPSTTIHVNSATELDPLRMKRPDFLWASPPCQSFSSARSSYLEERQDRDLALACIPFISVLKPTYFVLEQVPQFVTKGASILHELKMALLEHGYYVTEHMLNAVDYGVPQTRWRFFLRAMRGELPKPMLPPTTPTPLGWGTAWRSFDEFQLHTSLPPWVEPLVLKHPLYPTRYQQKLWVNCIENRRDKTITIRSEHDPVMTICASPNSTRYYRILLCDDIHQPTLRMLARLQTVPEWYKITFANDHAISMIGNGVPVNLARAVLESFL